MAMTIDFVSGCFGGMAGVLIGHPFDTIKVLMQTSKTHVSASTVLRNSSISSLYQGIKAPLSALAIINSIVFGVHGSIMRLCPRESRQQYLLWTAFAGAMSGIAQSIVTAPIELLKTRSQITSRPIWNCYKDVLRNEGGFRGLYRGFSITVARDCPAFATYFFTYECLLHRFRQARRGHLTTLDLLTAGGTAGALSWLVIYPLDVIKSRLQADNRYNSVRQCIKETVDRDGLAVLMRGCSPTLIRAFPTNGATFVVVTWTLCAYETHFNNDNNNSNNANNRNNDERNVN